MRRFRCTKEERMVKQKVREPCVSHTMAFILNAVGTECLSKEQTKHTDDTGLRWTFDSAAAAPVIPVVSAPDGVNGWPVVSAA